MIRAAGNRGHKAVQGKILDENPAVYIDTLQKFKKSLICFTMFQLSSCYEKNCTTPSPILTLFNSCLVKVTLLCNIISKILKSTACLFGLDMIYVY